METLQNPLLEEDVRSDKKSVSSMQLRKRDEKKVVKDLSRKRGTAAIQSQQVRSRHPKT
jgi:hypothetical protein